MKATSCGLGGNIHSFCPQTLSVWTSQEGAAISVLSSSPPSAPCAKFPAWLRMYWMAQDGWDLHTILCFSYFYPCSENELEQRERECVCACTGRWGYEGPASGWPEGWAGTYPGEQPVPAEASCSWVTRKLKSEQQLTLGLSPASNMSQPL